MIQCSQKFENQFVPRITNKTSVHTSFATRGGRLRRYS